MDDVHSKASLSLQLHDVWPLDHCARPRLCVSRFCRFAGSGQDADQSCQHSPVGVANLPLKVVHGVQSMVKHKSRLQVEKEQAVQQRKAEEAAQAQHAKRKVVHTPGPKQVCLFPVGSTYSPIPPKAGLFHKFASGWLKSREECHRNF